MRLYNILRNGLKKSYGQEPTGNQARHLNTLTSMVFGIIQSRNVKLAEVASEVPNSGKDESKITQFRRWLANEAITFELYYLPFLQVVLTTLASAGHPLVLVIDGSTTGRGCVTLMVSVVYQNRTLPLMWVTRKGKKGHFPENTHVELIKAVYSLIPQGVEVICLGDGEFDGVDWLETLQQFRWRYVCRTARDSVFYEDGERFIIQDVCPARGDCTGITGVCFTEKQFGPLTAVAWWGRKYKDPIYLVSNFSLPDEACFWYKKRFRIETMFSDASTSSAQASRVVAFSFKKADCVNQREFLAFCMR